MDMKTILNRTSGKPGFKLEDEIYWKAIGQSIITGGGINLGSTPSMAMINPVYQRVFCAYQQSSTEFGIAVGALDYPVPGSPISWIEQENLILKGVSPSIAAVRTSKGEPWNNPEVHVYVMAIYSSGTANSQVKLSISTLQEDNSLVAGEEFVVGLGIEPNLVCFENQVFITYVNKGDHKIYCGLGTLDYDKGILSLSFPYGINPVSYRSSTCEGSYPSIAWEGEYCVLFYQGNNNLMYSMIGEVIGDEISWLSGVCDSGTGLHPCIAYTHSGQALVMMYSNPDTLSIYSQIGKISGHGQQIIWNDLKEIGDTGYQVDVCSSGRVIVSAHKASENEIYYDLGDVVEVYVPDH